MIYAAMLAAIVFAISMARIVYLNSEVEILDDAGEKLQKVIEPQEGKIPEALQEEETEYVWATTARDIKKEGRTLWYGLAFLSFVALVTALVEFIRS